MTGNQFVFRNKLQSHREKQKHVGRRSFNNPAWQASVVPCETGTSRTNFSQQVSNKLGFPHKHTMDQSQKGGAAAKAWKIDYSPEQTAQAPKTTNYRRKVTNLYDRPESFGEGLTEPRPCQSTYYTIPHKTCRKISYCPQVSANPKVCLSSE